MCSVIALHGDFASGSMLRRDCGIESWAYPNWKRKPYLPSEGGYVLVGYSRGGSEIGHLSREWHRAIRAAVLYESPLLGTNRVYGDFPALWIENDWGRRLRGGRYAREMQETLETWQLGGRRVDQLIGRGRHVEFTRGWPPFRHGWDRSLNRQILDWIESQK